MNTAVPPTLSTPSLLTLTPFQMHQGPGAGCSACLSSSQILTVFPEGGSSFPEVTLLLSQGARGSPSPKARRRASAGKFGLEWLPGLGPALGLERSQLTSVPCPQAHRQLPAGVGVGQSEPRLLSLQPPGWAPSTQDPGRENSTEPLLQGTEALGIEGAPGGASD